MTIKLDCEYPDHPDFEPGIRRAPDRGFRLTKEQTKIALKNALRYVPEELHEKLAPEFMEELTTRAGYMPTDTARQGAYTESQSANTRGNAWPERLFRL